MEIPDIKQATSDMGDLTVSRIQAQEITVPQSLPEVDIFALLLWRFKHPNGFYSLSIPHGDPDAPFKWDFIFKQEGLGTIHIVRTWQHLEISILDRRSINTEELLQYLKFNLERYKKEIAETKNTRLEKYTLLTNPYKKHKRIARNVKKALEEVSTIEKPTLAKGIVLSKMGAQTYMEKLLRHREAIELEGAYSTLLVVQSAFMVETYINMLIRILSRNEETYKKLRMPWWKKLKKLHELCKFVQPIDTNTPLINRDLRKVFRMRDNIAHSKLDKEKLKTGTMWFYQRFPILEKPESYITYQFPTPNITPTRRDALEAFEIAESTTKFIEKHLETRITQLVRILIDTDPLGYNETKGIYSIPFGPDMAIFFAYKS